MATINQGCTSEKVESTKRDVRFFIVAVTVEIGVARATEAVPKDFSNLGQHIALSYLCSMDGESGTWNSSLGFDSSLILSVDNIALLCNTEPPPD